MWQDNKGFTLIEILMVILLVAILAGVAVTQFVDFSGDARNTSTKGNLEIIRKGIAAQYSVMRLKCSVTDSSWPTLGNLNANDITSAVPCTVALVPNASDRKFVSGVNLPPNPWGSAQLNTVYACTVAGCTSHNLKCVGGGARAATDDGWCYNATSGEFWANSGNNGAGAGAGDEYNY